MSLLIVLVSIFIAAVVALQINTKSNYNQLYKTIIKQR